MSPRIIIFLLVDPPPRHPYISIDPSIAANRLVGFIARALSTTNRGCSGLLRVPLVKVD